MRLTAAVIKEGNWYAAKCLEVEVTSQGETVESSIASLREAVELYFEDEPPQHIFEGTIIAPFDIEVSHLPVIMK